MFFDILRQDGYKILRGFCDYLAEKLYLCTVKSKITKKMEVTTARKPSRRRKKLTPEERKAINAAKPAGNSDMSMMKDIKKAISMLKGVTKVQKQKTKPRLYDPETGDYLNDETMKVIEDAHKGVGVTRYNSLQDFYKEMGL